MSRTHSPLARAAALLVVALALAAPTPSASAADPTTPAASTADRQVPTTRSLENDVVRPDGGPGLAPRRARLWPGHVIHYAESIPAKWQWGLDQAIRHWNEAGAGIRFKKTSRPRPGDLRISYGDTGGADGMATIGHQARNWVHLSPAYRQVDETDPMMRVWSGRLFAHELGHVLGFEHTHGCQLMTPVFVMGPGGCPLLSEQEPGYYHCRWIDKPLLRRFISWYGGRASRPPELCLIEALPPKLTGVAFSGGGQSGPVTVTWEPPGKVRPGTKVVVDSWQKPECAATPPNWATSDPVTPSAGVWVQPGHGQGESCYLVRIVNRYGAGRTGGHDRREMYAPVPAPPELGALVWRAEQGAWRFTWAGYEDADLMVLRGAPGQCVTAYDPDLADRASHLGADRWQVYAQEAEECLTFFVATTWGTVSGPTSVEVAVPAPQAPSIALTWDGGSGVWRAVWSSPDPSGQLVVQRGAPGACPQTYDGRDAEWLWEADPGVYEVPAYEVDECLSFFVVNEVHRASAATVREAHVPAPTVTPTVGQTTPGPAGSGYATVTATIPGDPSALSLRVEVVPGACPQPVPVDAGWWDGDQDWSHPSRWYLYPEPWDSTAPSCAHVAVFDQWERHGPVVSRTFTAG